MPATSQLALPYPADGDPADVPVDMQELADRVELVIADGHLAGQIAGDIKISARTASHGRWLLCSDRELTQAEIETELVLAAGKAAAFVALLGTGAASIFGAAGASKVKIPEGQGKVLLGQSATHPKTGTGSSGGAEAVTLTANESGRRGHTHTSPGHSHAATQAAHQHVGMFDGSSNPMGINFQEITPLSGAVQTGYFWAGEYANSARTSVVTPAITVPSTTVAIDAVADAVAAEDHENMPPYRVLGHVFIRV